MLPVLFCMYETEKLPCRSEWTASASCIWYVAYLPFSDIVHTAIVHTHPLPLEPGPGECGKYKDVPEQSYPVEGLSLLVFHPCIIDILIKSKCRLCVCMLLSCNKLIYAWSLQTTKTNNLLKKLTASQNLIFYGTQTFITVSVRGQNLILFWATWLLCTPTNLQYM